MAKNHNAHPFETPRILHDWPLQDAGQPAQFMFQQYAVTLARLIADKTTKTPFTLGVSGAWGSGKTSLLHCVKAMLDETACLLEATAQEKLSFINAQEKPSDYRACRTVWFNAWKYADEEHLLVALIRVIVQAMFADDWVSKCAAAVLEPFTPRRDVIDTVLGWFSIKSPFGDVSLSTGKPIATPFSEKTALLDLFDEVFVCLMAAWVHHSRDYKTIDPTRGVLVVFIDDLDRCLPPKMLQVLEAIKLFMDKPGCVFVIGADKDVIQQAVEKEYESAGVKGQTASDYLEKIIQLRFHLPPISDADMDAFVKSQVADAVLNAHWRIVAMGAESNPRKVKTFLNDLQLQWAVWQNTGQGRGVNFDDFVRWEVVMRAAPALRRRMYGIYDAETRGSLLSKAFAWAQGDEDAAASFRQDMNEQARRVLKDILPFQDHFTPAAITRLVYLVAPAAEPAAEGIEKPAKELIEPVSVVTGIPPRKEAEDDLLGEAMTLPPRYAGQRTPGGQELFEFGGLQFVKIPKGEFLMGSTADNPQAYDDERPQFKLNIPYDYWLGRFPVTNAQYAQFKKGYKISDGKEDHPVVEVTWHDAQAYVAWLNQQQESALPAGCRFCLPSEAEWERAARGEFGNEWPWGNEFDPQRCNTGEGKKGDTTPVGAYSPQGDSPYGCAEMAGNVWEWTRSLVGEYPYPLDGTREYLKAEGTRVLRGGSFNRFQWNSRCACRLPALPIASNLVIGFRVGIVSPIHSG